MRGGVNAGGALYLALAQNALAPRVSVIALQIGSAKQTAARAPWPATLGLASRMPLRPSDTNLQTMPRLVGLVLECLLVALTHGAIATRFARPALRFLCCRGLAPVPQDGIERPDDAPGAG